MPISIFRRRQSASARRRILTCIIVTSFALTLIPLTRLALAQKQSAPSAIQPSASFTAGDLVIYRVGTGSAALSSAATAVFLDEYTTSGGAPVQSIAMPTADSGANQTLTASGTATSEGLLTRSTDGNSLTLTGYDAAPGTANVTSSSSSTINRVIGRVDASGTVNTTTALTDAISGGNPRSSVSTNGTDLWIAGTSSGGGIRYTTLGATTSTALNTATVTNLRQTNIFGGQLYVSSQSGAFRLATVGSGTPTTSGQTITNLPGYPTATTSPYGFFFADLNAGVAGVDTLYVADDNGAGGTGGIQKYSLVSGSWVANGSIANTTGLRGLTGVVNGSNVTLYTTNPSTLLAVTDTTGYNATITGTLTSIATAPTNTAFRGVALAPVMAQPTPTPTPALTINDVTQSEGNSGMTAFTFTVSLSPASTQTVTVDYATANGTTNPATGGASCGPGVDYITTSGTLTFNPSDTAQPITVQVCGDATTEPNETFFVNLSNAMNAAIGDSQGVGTISNDDVSITPIHDIQGSGNTSPFAGQSVTTTGIVTGLRSNGFFLQTPDAQADANPSTSEGIFVFTSSAPPATAAIGNSVNVTATVQEFIPSADPNSPPVTELISPSVSLNSTGNTLPAAVTITAADMNVNDINNIERLEGMRVHVNSLTVCGPTQGNINEANATATSNGVFYGVITGTPRPFREPGIQVPDPVPSPAPPNVPRFDANPERLRVDSDAQPGTTPIDVTAGAVVTNLTGPLDYAFRTYTILPDAATTPGVSGNLLGAIPVPTPLSTELTVASFNMERFFDTTDDPGISDVALTTTAFNNRLNKASLVIRNVMRTPDVIGVEEMENLPTLQAVANKVNTDAVAAGQPNPNYQAYLVEGNDVGGIDVGFLVKAARVSVVDVTQFGKTTTYTNPNNGQQELLNDRPPLVLRATISAANGSPYAFTVIVNHLRSLGSIDDPVDGNRVRTKRRAQAEYLANLIQGRQAADPTENIISVGDYNAFDVNDGYVDVIGTIKGTPAPPDQVVLASPDLVNPDLTDLVSTLPADQRYSYTFDGNAQVLDHELVNQPMMSRLARFAYARNDSDFPTIYYGDPSRPERISDHDMPVAYFSLGSPLLISEFRFRGPTFDAGMGIDGALDEYIELYNISSAPLQINATDGSGGWALAYTNGAGTTTAIAAVIPNNVTIPPRGHYLLTNDAGGVTATAKLGQPTKSASLRLKTLGFAPVASAGYTLSSYAPGDQTYGGGTTDIPDDGAIALFQTANVASFSSLTRLDAVSLNAAGGATATLFREGTNLPSPGANDGQYAFVRKLSTGTPQDTDNNAQDFVFVSTNAGSYGGVQSQLGAPGPENTASPVQRNAQIKASLIEPNSPATASPNRVRDLTQVPNGGQGTLSIRRRFTNTTAQTVTRLRFRIVDVTTLNSPGYSPGGTQADLRAIDGSNFNISTSLGSLTVLGTTVEQPAPLLQPNGGGLNSSLTVAIPGGSLAPGATIDLHFLLGVQQGGSYRFFINVEALP